MKKTIYEVIHYDIHDDFYVEVTMNTGCYDCVLCKENYGIKVFMFGLKKEDFTTEQLEEIIESNVEEYISGYISDYCEE